MSEKETLYQPPGLSEKLLRLVCKGVLLEEIEGDLFEHYQVLRQQHSKWKANVFYWFHVVHFLRPFALKKFGQNSNTIIMYRSYFKFAIRNMWRQKMNTVFNLAGLILAFVVCGFIYLHLKHELSYDTFLEHSEDIYRVAWMNDNPQTRTPHPMAQAMVNDLPEVISAVSISPIYGPGLTKQSIPITLEKSNISFEEPDGYFADSTFFDVFSYDFLQGNPETALNQPFGIILTASMAKRYFGDDPAVGNRLSFGTNTDMLEVVGVVEDVPVASHFHFNFLISYVTLKSLNFNDPWLSWQDFGHFNYIRLKAGSDRRLVESKIPEWVQKYLNWSEESISALLAGEDRFALQPIEDIHLHSNIRWELESNSSTTYLLIYGISGLFILLISVINFVNLSTARSAERLKEVGIKKTLGAHKRQLLSQFLFESLLISFLALVLSFMIIYGLEPAFNQLVKGNVLATDLWQKDVLLFLVTLTVITAILAASYPSFYLNSLHPGQILKGTGQKKIGGAAIRNGLLGVQLVAAVALVSGSLIINSQISFLKQKDLGFRQDDLVMIDLDNFEDKSELIKSGFAQFSGVNGVSTLSNVPGGQFNQHPIYAEQDPSNRVDAAEMFIDSEALDVLGLDLIAGRALNKSFAADSAGTAFLVNESAVSELGLEDPLGQTLFWVDNENLVKGTIVGVVKDFHYKSLHVPIRPIIMMMRPRSFNYILVKVDAQNLSTLLPQLQNAYEKIFPDNTFKYQFLDEEISALYVEESRTLLLTSLLSGISIFLAVAGLIGIVSIAIRQRMKEIGIRKILGASIAQLLLLVNSRYLLIATIALIIGVPISYFSMSRWMDNFTYQQNIGALVFVLTALGVLALIFVTISCISLKTARSNPADALRVE